MFYIYKVVLINDNEETVVNAVSVRKDVPRLKTGNVKQGINTINSFTFSIEQDNPGFNKINLRKTLVNVLNTKTNKYEFEGRVLIPTQNMGNDPLIKSLVCESELGYLQDSTQSYGEYHDVTVQQFLEIIIANHNSQVEDYKKFTVGIVNVIDSNNSLYRFLGYDKTLDTIKDKLINRLGGEIQIRKENGIRYLDYLQRIGSKKDTVLKMNKNLKTIEQKKDPTTVVTRLRPLGTKLNGTEERLTIASVNGGNEYLDNLEGQAAYGINQDNQIWDDVTKPENLLTKGIVALNNATKVLKQHKISALELFLIDKDPDALEVGNDYRVVNSVMEIDEDLRVIEKTIDILDPRAGQLTIGDKFETMTGKQASVQRTAAYVQSIMTGNGNLNGSFISGFMDLLRVQMGAMADSAEKQQAKAILFEDRISGSPTFGAMALGTQGFMISDQLDAEGQWIWKTFGTGKGFTADLIVAGTILADMIRGGTLSSLSGNLKIGLDDDGKMTTYGTDNGYKALEFQNRTLTFFDFLNSAQVIGQIEPERELDGNGNATGLPRLAIGIKQGAKFTVSDMDNNAKAILVIDNNASDSNKKTGILYLDNLTITNSNGTGGITIGSGSTDAITVFGKINLNGWSLTNIGGMNMSTGVGQSANGITGWFSNDTKKLIITNGVITDMQDI